jgi:hypothetical protein
MTAIDADDLATFAEAKRERRGEFSRKARKACPEPGRRGAKTKSTPNFARLALLRQAQDRLGASIPVGNSIVQESGIAYPPIGGILGNLASAGFM